MQTRKKDLIYFLTLLLLHAVPAVMMKTPDFPGAFYAPYSGMYSNMSWLCIPALSGIVVFVFVVKEKRCSWLLILETVIATLGYVFVLHKKDAGLFCSGLILLLILELFPMLQKVDRIMPEKRACKLLRGLEENWEFLARVYYWSVLFVFSVRWLLLGDSQYTSWGIIIVEGPMPIIMLLLPGFLKKPLHTGGWLGIFMLLVVAICICIGPYSYGLWGLYLLFVLIGFGLMSIRLFLRKYPA